MWLVEENINHAVLFFGEHLPGGKLVLNKIKLSYLYLIFPLPVHS